MLALCLYVGDRAEQNHGLVPDIRIGTTFGHEFTGVVEEFGPPVQNLKVGDQVLVPFNVFCASCYFCQRKLYSNCHDVNPESSATGAIYGHSHATGGYDGGQAEYARVPMADIGPTVIPADLDHAMRPAYPMARMPARLEGAHSHPPAQQPQTVEILQSIERPSMTPLFSTPRPPSAISGMLGRVAFKYTESDLRHWMLLLFADRVNVVEGLGADLKWGHIPNIFAEMGG